MRSAFVQKPSSPPFKRELIGMNDNHMPKGRAAPEPEPELYVRPMAFVYAFGTFLICIGLLVLWQ